MDWETLLIVPLIFALSFVVLCFVLSLRTEEVSLSSNLFVFFPLCLYFFFHKKRTMIVHAFLYYKVIPVCLGGLDLKINTR